MKEIIFKRPKESFNKNCSYKILIGQTALAELNNGEEKRVKIPEDLLFETLKAKVHWCGSKEMDVKKINDGDNIKVTGNYFLNKKLPLLGAIFPLTALLIFNVDNIILKNIGIGINVLLFIYLIWVLTIGRNSWISIKKESKI